MIRHSRTVLFALVAVIGLSLPGAAFAAPRPHVQRLTAQPTARIDIAAAAHVALAHIRRPMTVRAHQSTPTITSADQLQIPWTDWPAGSAQEQGATVAPTSLDDINSNPFVGAHSATATYAAAGAEGGYLQGAVVPITESTSAPASSAPPASADAYWLGTYYPTADAALSRVTDVVTLFTGKSVTPISCNEPSLPNCDLFAFTIPNSNPTPSTPATYVYGLMVFALGNAVGETLVIGDNAQVATTTSIQSFGEDLGKIGFSGEAVVANGSPSAGPASITIDQVSVAHVVKKTLKSTKTLKSGEAGYFLVAFHTTNAGTEVPTGTITIMNGSKQIASGNLQGINIGTTAAPQVVLGAKAKLKNTSAKTQHLTVQVLLTLGDSTDAGSARFKLKPKK
jgi:hypothetical protein